MKHSRPPLVLIYGYRGAPLGFEELAGALRTANFEVFIPPIPPNFAADSILSDFMSSDNASVNQFTPAFYADYLAYWLRSSGLAERHPVIIGHSMGSIIAAALAEKHPELIADQLILMAPIAQKVAPVFRPLTPLTAFLPNQLISLLTTRYLIVNRGQPKGFFHHLYQASVLCGAEHHDRRADFSAAKFSAHWAVADFSFPQRTLFIAGEHDRMNPTKAVQNLAAARSAEFILLPSTGHLLNYEFPTVVAEKIVEFLER